MKKMISMLMMFVLLLAVCAACGDTVPDKPADSEKLSVVATIFAPYDFARTVAGDHAEVTMLLPPGSESHSYEPTPQDIAKVMHCGVFIYVGGESDEWVNRMLSTMDTSKMQIVTLMDCVQTVEEQLTGSMQQDDDAHDHEHEDEAELDEHVWTAPGNAKLITQKISDAVCAADPEHADAYRVNTAAYLAELDDLDAQFRAVVDGGVRKTIVFGDRFPFRYFADAYGLDYDAAFPGCSDETEASMRTVTSLIDKIKAEQIPVVFHLELSSKAMAETISKETGAKVRQLHACHNISKDDLAAGKTYLGLMRGNVDALREALN